MMIGAVIIFFLVNSLMAKTYLVELADKRGEGDVGSEKGGKGENGTEKGGEGEVETEKGIEEAQEHKGGSDYRFFDYDFYEG